MHTPTAKGLEQQWIRLVPLLPLTQTSTTSTTCGTLCWDSSVMCSLAFLWMHILMTLPWGELHVLAILPSTYFAIKKMIGSTIAATMIPEWNHCHNYRIPSFGCPSEYLPPRQRHGWNTMAQNHGRAPTIQVPILASFELLHQRGRSHKLRGSVPVRNGTQIWLPSVQDFEEMVPCDLNLREPALLFR